MTHAQLTAPFELDGGMRKRRSAHGQTLVFSLSTAFFGGPKIRPPADWPNDRKKPSVYWTGLS